MTIHNIGLKCGMKIKILFKLPSLLLATFKYKNYTLKKKSNIAIGNPKSFLFICKI
jgi:hypothetical protein